MGAGEFGSLVYATVAQIPSGRVMTYGQIAALCGSPRAARVVGGLAHFGPEELPWHRVVNKQGGLASGFPGGRALQAELLTDEGLEVVKNRINVEKALFWTQHK